MARTPKAQAASPAKAAPKAPAKGKGPFTVTATANGYYGNKLRVPGEEFAIEKSEDFSKNWMTSEEIDGNDERFVATGGTDGVVGATVKPGELSDQEKALFGISDNDDRRRDLASDQSDNPPPATEDDDDK